VGYSEAKKAEILRAYEERSSCVDWQGHSADGKPRRFADIA
jgi:hypothetical protein